MINKGGEKMEKAYNIRFIPKQSTSNELDEISSTVVCAKNKESAKELGQAIVRDYYKGNEDMINNYKYIIERNE